MSTGEVTYSSPRLVDQEFSVEKGYIYRMRDNYIKNFDDTSLPKELSWAEKGKLSELRLFLIGDSQLLGRRKNGKFIPLTVEDISKVFECKIANAYRTISRAKEYKVIKEVLIENILWYTYNPLYGLKGKRINMDTFIAWQEELSPVLNARIKGEFIKQMTIKQEVSKC